jgi:CDP-paratose 2-epimerase
MEALMRQKILVTGGAGFIGTNLVDSLLGDDCHVTVFDALMRPGTKLNLQWLSERHRSDRFRFVHGDVRDAAAVNDLVRHADVVYHLAGQVAVTSSVTDPRTDFETNAWGTLNVLEAARLSGHRPAIVMTSTNKVYGAMESVPTSEDKSRYRYVDLPHGVAETQPIDFHSPYGCSKGSADQYVHDYARIYDLPTVVFRMSCIYGPRQFGTEDQGWVAHFVIAALTNRPITIYGDGKQVRDVLFVTDLVRALRMAVERLGKTAGEIFNIGGGSENTISVWHEFGPLLETLKGAPIAPMFADWRPGDQPCYVSDIRKAADVIGWRPVVDKLAGIRLLWDWAHANVHSLASMSERSTAA